MKEFVRLQTAILLRRLAYEVSRASKSADEDTIHDLRVAVRRLNRCLRVFSQFYPAGSWKKVRRKLGNLMDAAGNVRDCDIAIQLLRETGLRPDAPVFQALSEERHGAAMHLLSTLRRWKDHSVSRRWRGELGL